MTTTNERIARLMGGPEEHPDWWTWRSPAPVGIGLAQTVAYQGPDFESSDRGYCLMLDWLETDGTSYTIQWDAPLRMGTRVVYAESRVNLGNVMQGKYSRGHGATRTKALVEALLALAEQEAETP